MKEREPLNDYSNSIAKNFVSPPQIVCWTPREGMNERRRTKGIRTRRPLKREMLRSMPIRTLMLVPCEKVLSTASPL